MRECEVPQEDEIAKDPSCVICMEEMTGGGVSGSCTTRKLPCGHVLHTECLYRFVEKDQNCPICRRDFVSVALEKMRRKKRPVVRIRRDWTQQVSESQQSQVPKKMDAQQSYASNVEDMEAAYQEYLARMNNRTGTSLTETEPVKDSALHDVPNHFSLSATEREAILRNIETSVDHDSILIKKSNPEESLSMILPRNEATAAAYRIFYSDLSGAFGKLEASLRTSRSDDRTSS